MRRIGILTSGGDAPGMNPAIRAVVRTAIAEYNLEVIGFYRGYLGLIEGQSVRLDLSSVSGILNRGGTILKTARCEEFKTEAGQKKAVEQISKLNLDGLIIIGGNGTAHGAYLLANKWGVPVVQIPSTIDNDVAGTDFTIGFHTAVATATEAIDKLRDTASSIERLFIVEVMGRDSGHIALHTGLACGAEAILIPEIEWSIEEVCNVLKAGEKRGKTSSIIVVAEGVGSAVEIAKKIKDLINYDTRVAVIGHLQRGGEPTPIDRILASKLGAKAVEVLYEGKKNILVGIESNKFSFHPINYAYEVKKNVDLDLYKLNKILAS
ncbi:MAG: 6-phosphofructokinase [Nitrososphaerota archaeon]